MNAAYQQTIARLRNQHGSKFVEPAQAAAKFAQHYGHRVEVRKPYGETVRGYVVLTCGWAPAFMLLARRTAHGSSELIDERDELLRVLPDIPIR